MEFGLVDQYPHFFTSLKNYFGNNITVAILIDANENTNPINNAKLITVNILNTALDGGR